MVHEHERVRRRLDWARRCTLGGRSFTVHGAARCTLALQQIRARGVSGGIDIGEIRRLLNKISRNTE